MRPGFRGRGSMHSGRDCERKRKKTGKESNGGQNNFQKKRINGKKNLCPASYPVPPVPGGAVINYNHTCGNAACAHVWTSDVQEAFCPRCNSAMVSWTRIFLSP